MWVQINDVGGRLGAVELAPKLYALLREHGVHKPEARPDSYWDEFDNETFVVIVRAWDNLSPEKDGELRQAVVDFCSEQPGGDLRVVDV